MSNHAAALPKAAAVLTVTVAAALIAAVSASAGTYDVYVCGNYGNNVFGGSADPGWVAESNCGGGGGNLSTGISDPSQAVGDGTSARFTAAPPSGTTIAAMQVAFNSSSALTRPGWEIGVFRQNVGRVWGCDAATPCFPPTDPFDVPGVNGAGAISIQADCRNSGGCPGGGDIKLFTRYVKLTVDDSSAPNVAISGGGLAANTWVRGDQQLAWYADDNVGIRDWRHSIDGATSDKVSTGDCQLDQWTCSNVGDGVHFGFPTSTLPDGRHTVTVVVNDRAGNVNSASGVFYSDNTPPPPLSDLAVDGGEGWSDKPGFRLTWTNSTDPASGVRRAVYQLCRARTGECVDGTSPDPSGGKPSSSTIISLPRPGDWTAQAWLQDVAGNNAPDTARTVHLRYDRDPPQGVVFEDLDPTDPRQVTVDVDDPGSGLGSGEIDYRPSGSTDWKTLSSQVDGDRLVGSIDDESLPRGHYELRAIAKDQAGLSADGAKRKDGSNAGFDIPLRIPMTLQAGFPRIKHVRKRHRHKIQRVRVLVNKRKVSFGHKAIINGRLTTAAGHGLPGAPIEVSALAHYDGANWEPEGNFTTDGEGGFRYQAPPGVSRDLRIRFPGTKTIAAATVQLMVLVPAKSNIRADRRKLRNGDTVHLSGRVAGNPRDKLVALQALVRGRWRTFATVHTNGNGVWRYGYRFETVTRRAHFFLRARVPRESTFPFEPGGSHALKVLVRP